MLSRIGLERLCLILVAVMTAEVGYLWRAYTAPVERKVVVLEPVAPPAPEPATLIALAPDAPATTLAETTEPPAAPLPRRRERPGRTSPSPSPRPQPLTRDCVGSDDPLCGLPSR